jgi:N,N'-diacetyllegionaminate synthase
MQSRTIVIAEAGVNHNGHTCMALELVDAAAEAGADFVKFQTFSAERISTSHARKALYQIGSIGNTETQLEMLRLLELSKESYGQIIERCEVRGIGFLSTGFDIQSLDFLVALGVPMIKIPSGEITNLPYLRHVAELGLPTIMSTGMASIDEVSDAVVALEMAGLTRDQLTILHCTTEYPTRMTDVNLRAMLHMRDHFGVEVGYSDHTLGIEVSIAAVALGASVIEKHFTLDRSFIGPDHKASLEPSQLTEMVKAIRNIENALGDGTKIPRTVELSNKIVVRKSLVAARNISAGELFSTDNVAIKRPGNGISPMQWDKVIGKPAPRSFIYDELIEI